MNWISLIMTISLVIISVAIMYGMGFWCGFSRGKHRGRKEVLKVLESMRLKESLSTLIKLWETAIRSYRHLGKKGH